MTDKVEAHADDDIGYNVYRSANVLIREHSEDAAIEVAMRASGEVPGDLGGRETGAALGNGRYPSEAMISRKAASGNAFSVRDRMFPS